MFSRTRGHNPHADNALGYFEARQAQRLVVGQSVALWSLRYSMSTTDWGGGPVRRHIGITSNQEATVARLMWPDHQWIYLTLAVREGRIAMTDTEEEEDDGDWASEDSDDAESSENPSFVRLM